MSSETDLSTADLAQHGGARQQDPAGDEQRRDRHPADQGERTYETSGNQVTQDPGDQDAAGLAPGGGGSTRDDAVRAERPGRLGTSGDLGDRDLGDRDLGGQDLGGRDLGGRDLADRDMAGQGMADRGAGDAGGDVALLDPGDAEAFRRRWSDTQGRFVDDPREAVQTADALVAELMQTLASSFSQHKGVLEEQWRGGGDADTEELRQALQRYRSFFDRLLSA